MPKETFMLVSLKEQKAKKLAQVISSPACRRILDYLAQKEATETEIATNLNMPISTVHYNLTHLKESNLVEVEEFHYSSKGKEVSHYKLANKYIIISPKGDSGFIDKLKTLLPVSLIFAAGIAVWQFLQGNVQMAGTTLMKAAPALESADYAVAAAAPLAQEMAQPIWPYFVYGAVIALALFIIVDSIRKKFK